MADGAKRTECVKVCFDERTYIDLNRLAVREDRKMADMVYVLVRRGMYGIVNAGTPQDEGTERD